MNHSLTTKTETLNLTILIALSILQIHHDNPNPNPHPDPNPNLNPNPNPNPIPNPNPSSAIMVRKRHRMESYALETFETRFLEAEFSLHVASLHAELDENDKTIDKLVRQSKSLQKEREADKQHISTLCDDIREMYRDLKTLKRMLRWEIVEHEATIAKLRVKDSM